MNSSTQSVSFAQEQPVLINPEKLLVLSSNLAAGEQGWRLHSFYFMYLLFTWQIAAILWKFWWKAPVRMKRRNILPRALILCPEQHHHSGLPYAPG